MRHYSTAAPNIATSNDKHAQGSWAQDMHTIKRLVPYLKKYTIRIVIAVGLLIAAKLSSIAIPIVLKEVIDTLNLSADSGSKQDWVALPVMLIIAYGSLRLFSILFQELRNAIFAKAGQESTREISLRIFEHLHTLSLRFHLDRQTGGISSDIARGTQSISSLYRWLLFSLIPTFFEVFVVCGYLFYKFGGVFAVITTITILLYSLFTFYITNWRTKFRIRMIESDSEANNVAVDSLLNYETIKYFNNENHEYERYDEHIHRWQQESVKAELSLSLLNTGQGFIIGAGSTILLVLAAFRVINGELTVGEWAMLSAFMMQLFIPLNMLGTLFREIKRSLIDIGKMFSLLEEKQEVTESKHAKTLSKKSFSVEFDKVHFSYNKDREILKGISFKIPSGHKVAIVGSSGAGKSTLARLLFRFYNTTGGNITIDKTNINQLTLDDLRKTIGVVPQDTVLFNDSLKYNILYGKPGASDKELQQALSMANLDTFIEQLPQGLDTKVGERGLKLSGGEKQRVAIARTILKNPDILILDEATSSLDSKTEKDIQGALDRISENRTTLVIAHRLSTIVDSDNIVVLDKGKVIEQGSHAELLKLEAKYYDLWHTQQATE